MELQFYYQVKVFTHKEKLIKYSRSKIAPAVHVTAMYYG